MITITHFRHLFKMLRRGAWASRRNKKARSPQGRTMAHPAGFEPTAYRLGGGRSILLSYGCRCMGIIAHLPALCKHKTPSAADSGAKRSPAGTENRILQFAQKYSENPVEKHSKCRISIAILQVSLYHIFCRKKVQAGKSAPVI